jgi:hypothetical protein
VVQAAVLETAELPAAGERVDHIYLNPRLTGGLDLDGVPGDEALSVLIEPRNQAGAVVPAAGEVVLVVLDPQLQGPGARFARWDFEASETQQFLRTETLDRGLLFRLPWPNPPPAHGRLHLFVRYITGEGRPLEAERVIQVRVAAPVQDRWTPRPDRPSQPQADSPVDAVRPAPWTPLRSGPPAQ